MTTVSTPHLDGKHVVFGEVLSGKSIVRQIENERTQGDKPQRECSITDCGELLGAEAESIPRKQPDKLGDPYEDYPEDEKKDNEELPGTQIVKIATDLKGFGNTAFKTNQLALAVDKYQKGLRYLHEHPEPLEGEPKDLGEELNRLKISMHLNAAQCYNKMEHYDQALRSTSAALDIPGITEPEKGKAYYRRAIAKGGSKDEEAAMHDLEAALKAVPGDPNATNELHKMKTKAAEHAQKEKAAYKKFFA